MDPAPPSTLPGQWPTDDDLARARLHFTALNPGYRQPASYGAARITADGLDFGEVNPDTEEHKLPATILAFVGGHRSGTETVRLTRAQLVRAVELLDPADAATHMDHPNLWSWRRLVAEASEHDEFVAFFVDDPSDPVVDELDAEFRARLATA